MGEFIKAKHAWMIPTSRGVVEEDNRDAPGTLPIIKIDADKVEEFKERFDFQDFKYIPLYSGVFEQDAVIETRRTKNERSK